MPNFDTERLFLRSWQLSDVDFVFDLYSRSEVQRFIGRVPRVMETRAQAVERVERLAGPEHPFHGYWAVGRRDTGALVGTVILKPIPASGALTPLEPSGDIEIGWHFHPEAWGNGYATEAASAVLDHAFSSGLTEVVAVVNPQNFASQRVCTRIGMAHRGQTDRYYNATCELFVATQPSSNSH
jgi:RimJ/RimL family protein N-acetyltransferase